MHTLHTDLVEALYLKNREMLLYIRLKIFKKKNYVAKSTKKDLNKG